MKKKLFLLLGGLVLAIASAFGQRSLEIKDITKPRDVFSGKDTEAGIVISCPANIKLTIESSHDKVVDVYNTEDKGEEIFYYLRFETGKRYRGRKLTIRADGYAPVTIMAELNPKELKRYQLIDPDVEFVYGCYYEYRKRGTEYFQQAMYSEAREQYAIAQECSDCPENSGLDVLIANIDSISSYKSKAESAFELMDYELAKEYYGRVLALNPSDESASSRLFDCTRNYNIDVGDTYEAQDFVESVNRLYGIGASLDTAGIRFSIVLVMIAFMLSRMNNPSRKNYMWIYILSFILITIIGNMIARTTTVGVGLALLYLLYTSKIYKLRLVSSQKRIWMWLMVCISLTIPVFLYFYHTNMAIQKYTHFAFEGFFSLFETGKWEVASNEKLMSMYISLFQP